MEKVIVIIMKLQIIDKPSSLLKEEVSVFQLKTSSFWSTKISSIKDYYCLFLPLPTLTILLTPEVCVFPLNNSSTAAGCPTVQFTSGTVCLELGSDPTG